MALQDRLYDNLRSNLPGAVDNLINTELWNVLDDACRTAFIWRETISVTLEEDVITYSLTPAGTEIITVFSASHDTLDTTGALYEFGSLYLVTAPTASDITTPLFVVAALTPSLTSGGDVENLIPEDMWSKYHHLLLHGVLARMMAQPAKPYANPTLAAFHMRSYTNQKFTAKREAATGYTPAPQPWLFPRWA